MSMLKRLNVLYCHGLGSSINCRHATQLQSYFQKHDDVYFERFLYKNPGSLDHVWNINEWRKDIEERIGGRVLSAAGRIVPSFRSSEEHSIKEHATEENSSHDESGQAKQLPIVQLRHFQNGHGASPARSENHGGQQEWTRSRHDSTGSNNNEKWVLMATSGASHAVLNIAKDQPAKVSGLFLMCPGSSLDMNFVQTISPSAFEELMATGHIKYPPSKHGHPALLSIECLKEFLETDICAREGPLEIHCPVLTAHGEDDCIVPIGNSGDMMKRIQSSYKEFIRLPDTDHYFDLDENIQKKLDNLMDVIRQNEKSTRRLTYFNGFRLLLWVGVAMAFGIDWSSSVYFLGMPDKFSKDYLGPEILKHYGLNVSQLAYFTAVVYDSENQVRWRSVMVMGSVSKVLSIQYAVMIFCGTRMHRKMAEKLEQFSISNRKMHKQLFKTLVIQITVPTFIIFMPVLVMFVVPFFNLQIGVPTGIVLCALSIYPFVDGVIVICIVSDYRKAAIGERKSRPRWACLFVKTRTE